MRLISKKEVQALRSREIDKANLEKDKVDRALSESIRRFNEWKEQKKEETRQIENDLQNMVARYNIQIDDLIATVSQLKKAREIYLIPTNQLEKQAQIKNQEADKKLKECDELRKQLETQNKQLLDKEKSILIREQRVEKEENNIKQEKIKIENDINAIKIANEKLLNDKIAFEKLIEDEKYKLNDKQTEIKAQMSKIKAQIEVNKEQKLQNYKDQQKNISDREAVNSAWAEIKKLKEKYDRR